MIHYVRFILSRITDRIYPEYFMKKRTGIILLLSILLAAAVFFALLNMFILIGGNLISVRSEEVDLSGTRISDISPLMRLSSPSRILLRGCDIRPQDYDTLSGRFPHCEILWDIPLSCGQYPSDSEEIAVSSLTEADISLLSLFPNLQCIDTRSFILAEELKQSLAECLPACTILYSISAGDAEYDVRTEMLPLGQSNLSADELIELLAKFPSLREVDLTGTVFQPEEQLALCSAFPSIHFLWDVSLYGNRIPNSVSSLDFSASPPQDLSLLQKAAPLFSEVRDIYLGAESFEPGVLSDLCAAWNDTVIHCQIEAFGRTFSTDDTELDLSGIEIRDTSLFDPIVRAMPELEKVVLCDCGIPDEEMDQLNHRYDGVRFVWTVHFSIYSLRTDADNFCASNVPERNYIGINMTDAQIYPLRYCTDLVALDLGHMTLMTDLSVLKDMLHLRFLILSTNGMNGDISLLSTFKDLYYLELFHNTIQDLSPLLECPNLQHLNIGYCVGYDIAPLMEMKQLKRLWIPGNSLTDEQKAALESALPDTYIYMPRGDVAGSTGGDWRVNEAYYEMRDLLHMHYMPGDAGYHLNDNG